MHDAWVDQSQWRVLETRFGSGLNFLQAWYAWRGDPRRPRLLHFVSFEPSSLEPQKVRQGVEAHPHLLELADMLAGRSWGLVAGSHRLAFESGRVLLTLYVGDWRQLLPRQDLLIDSILLGQEREPFDRPAIKALTRCCHRGTQLRSDIASPDLAQELRQGGFVIDQSAGAALQGTFDPSWNWRRPASGIAQTPAHALVIGAGLAGAATAASLARRGWQVQVLDAAASPASGASALPAGLLAPHTTPDDNLLSRLSRSGVRITLEQAAQWLQAGKDWGPSGVLELRRGDVRPLPPLGHAQDDWQQWRGANGGELWHGAGAWIKPAALVAAWLGQEGIWFQGGARVERVVRERDEWLAMDATDKPIGGARLVVVAAAQASSALLGGRVLLNPVRGQVTWSLARAGSTLPPTPVNGNGHFLPAVPLSGGTAWLTGSTYIRGDASADVRESENAANLDRLRHLLPDVAEQLEDEFQPGAVQAWAGVRCTSSDRRPLVGELAPGLWITTAMGSRGLTFAALCGELLAARLHDEPLPLERRLAQALALERQRN